MADQRASAPSLDLEAICKRLAEGGAMYDEETREIVFDYAMATLIRSDVPALIAEIERLRTQYGVRAEAARVTGEAFDEAEAENSRLRAALTSGGQPVMWAVTFEGHFDHSRTFPTEESAADYASWKNCNGVDPARVVAAVVPLYRRGESV